MDPVPIAAGMTVWIVTLIGYVVHSVRLCSSRFTKGTVVGLKERPAGDGTAWHPTVRYRTLDGGVGEFQSGWGFDRQRWFVGEPVSVRIYDGRPELHDNRLTRTAVATGIVIGGMLVLGPYLSAATPH